MAEYNAPFFKLYEAFFLKLRERLGTQGVEIWKETMREALFKSYLASGAKKEGGIDEFIRFVKERDESVGLKVSFEKTSHGFIYRFHTDPFPGLKGKTDWKIIVEAYLSAKLDFFLGDRWNYQTTKHIWEGESFTEHVFTKID
ncbi:MAG: hypothetical protein PVH61_32660 [Candidatus Aminicenantes bacterium]|jgi:hypothetical protein